ncbi:ABC transporter permease [Halomontanus rarus]|uniref:ABC transporter permease n=1 Tax=Halomontanus rarus TaxID=3034020 RepID=UPI0023E80E48|nr:ABC transporter permease [Halovivax sp. TS33]
MSEQELQEDVSPFDTVSKGTFTRSERYQRLFELYFVAPAKIVWSDWRARFGVSILLMYIFMGTVGTLIVTEPSPMQGPVLLSPFQDWQYPLGTTSNGQSLFSLLVHSTPPMLKMMTTGAVVSVLIASIVGTVSGYKGGYLDTILMTITDIMLTLPGLPLTIILAAITGATSPYVIGFILTVHSWSGLARALRSQVLTLRDEPYVEASRLMGISTRKIIARDLVPNLAPYIGINFMGSARGVIFGSVALYFLGVLPFTNLNWGVVLNRAYNGGAMYGFDTAHWLIAPLFTITLIALALVLLAQGMDRLFNPRVRARHVDTGGEAEHPATK